MPKKKEELTEDNYYTSDMGMKYISVSQIKAFMDCEVKAMAELKGEYTRPASIALVVGSYVDIALTGTQEEMDKFLEENKKDVFMYGNPEKGMKADFRKADVMIEKVKNDPLMLKTLSGEHQVIMTGDVAGVPCKIKIDSYLPGKAIVDLKTTADMQKAVFDEEIGHYVSWIQGYKYPLQLAVYQHVVEQNVGKKLPCYLTVVDKTEEPDIGVFQIDQETMDAELERIKDIVQNIQLIKEGKIEPKRCEKCNYCKRTKKARLLDWREVFGEIGEDE